jgi:hypothetical protein
VSSKEEASGSGQAAGDALMWDTLGNLGKEMGKFVAGSKCSPWQIPSGFWRSLSGIRTV